MAGDEARARSAGCDDFDTKPVDLPRLLRAQADEVFRQDSIGPEEFHAELKRWVGTRT